MKKSNEKIRNIAIIAHVDHGKTTLVDNMFRQSGVLSGAHNEDNDGFDRVLDSMDLERERGITIAAKNCSVNYKGVKINIIDTPGHADFGGEVERGLSMVDGAILLVDSSEGPLPQTRFVLEKALKLGLGIIVVINKIDRKDARIDEVRNEVFDLLIDLDADESQLELIPLYAIGRDGCLSDDPENLRDDLTILFDRILSDIKPPVYDDEAPFQMLVSDLGYSDYLGRLAIGKVINGVVKNAENLVCIGETLRRPLRVSQIQTYQGLSLTVTEEAHGGDIVVLSGIEDVKIGDTICDNLAPEALPRLRVDEPTVFMKFTINDGPLNGREGKNVQSSRIRERLMRETLLNVAIQVEEPDERDSFIVKGRGEFQMAILIETMRRENFEFCVGRPQVTYRYENGEKLEPIEKLIVDCEEQFMGVVTEKLSLRRGTLEAVDTSSGGRVRLRFSVPSRSLIGYRDIFLTDTKGTGIMSSWLEKYEPYRGDFPMRFTGSIVADRMGKAIPYAIYNLEPRGKMFVQPGDSVYEGMIVGEHAKDNDINVNICKEKKLSNMRAAGKDENVVVTKVKPMTVERAITFIRDDEMVEITPLSIRLRKAILSSQKRHNIEAVKKKLN
ncbi:MAG: translational GTPase TypA [Deltaproteobacteria bacterium]|nr:translational GTPase TypA [Deltaproteobacteria bacterium]